MAVVSSQGRRAYKKVTTNGSVTLHQRYIYRGYLQIACIDLTRSHHPDLSYILWDPTQPVATRPLAIQINGTWYTYGWDLTKNICELYSTAGAIATSYTYTPFGQVTASGSVTQIIQWSSEVWDSELGLVYYNWRYYDVMLGRWYCRDYIQERGGINLYSSLCNNPIRLKDYLGLQILHDVRQHARKDVKPTVELKASSAFMLVGLLLNHLYAGNGEAVFYDLKHLHIPELTYVAEADALISDGYYFMSQQKNFNKRKYTNPRTVNGKGIEESLLGDYSISASYVLYADKYRKKACRYEATIFVEDEFHVRQRSNEHDTSAIHFRNIVAATMNVIPNKSFFVKCEKKYSYDVCKDGLDFSRALN